MKRPACFCLALALAGCVAPEAPPPPRVSPAAAANPAVSTVGFEDAPLPNRKVGAPGGDGLIKIAR